jgi:predicted RNA binding protein YcfA (HicA-like mRNA interferase family)
MKLPRSVSGDDLANALGRIGYHPTRQTGSHIRLTNLDPPEHHVTVPKHNPIRVGTLSAILSEIAEKRKISKDQLVTHLFG